MKTPWHDAVFVLHQAASWEGTLAGFSGITKIKDASRKPTQGRFLWVQPSALITIFPRLSQALRRSEQCSLRLNQRAARDVSRSRWNGKAPTCARRATHSPPQNHPAPPTGFGPSLTLQKWQSQLCLKEWISVSEITFLLH